MEENNMTEGQVSLNAGDLQAIDSFRKQRNTSVLTIMFTDVKDFTRLTEEKGDEYSDRMRKLHDGILVSTVEEGGGGKVLKQIGDSIMAIFSEPSAAVEKALAIQQKLRAFNADPANPDKLLVRIGLNMGQVTVEDSVSLDVFGHVVNRAARIKEMADGGHVYLSYTVFDSAKGWVMSRPGKPYGLKLHGQYLVKGVDEPLAVYEVFDKAAVKPQAPLKGKKKGGAPALALALALVALGALAAFGVAQYKSTSVTFRNVNLNTKFFLDDRQEITLDGAAGQELRPSLTKIAPGPHVVYYDVSNVVRYYADIDVKRGRNIIEPSFDYNQMPGLERSLSYAKGGDNVVEATETFKYRVYEGAVKTDAEALLHIVIRAKPDTSAPGKLFFDYDADVTLNGKEIARQHFTADNTGTEQESRTVRTTIYKDDYHYYSASYSVSGASTQFGVDGGYIEYEKL
jgi:class 3 adenylate cyclase